MPGQMGLIDRLKQPTPGRHQNDEETHMKKAKNPAFPMSLAVLMWATLPGLAAAQEADLSCMSYRVLDKIPVADRYREFDVIVTNNCPGAVYWSMCLERLDSRNQKILESHTPGGYVEKDDKSRVNLQMKKSGSETDFRQRFQEFYANVAFGIERAPKAKCVAALCEPEKRELRTAFRANLASWETAEKNLAARLEAECPESGWGITEEVESCRAGIRATVQAELDQFEQKDSDLRERMESGEPAYCRIHGGDLVPR